MIKNVRKKLTNNKGFTLIELMIVIAIIGILAAIAVPQFMTYKAKAYNSASLSDANNLRLELESYYATWDKYPN
ncbi:MAG: prepilin-type N-terminal cleavage/methylation domain-containing protein [Desulfamplus sp.]|nr:prepilin-type N-terminal cleavage/methylation domain-containing protein [Desulfamplus sp.]